MTDRESAQRKASPLTPTRVVTAVVGIAVVAVGFSISQLVQQNRILREALLATSRPTADEPLEVGAALPEIRLNRPDADGLNLPDALDASGGLVVFLTTTCPYCVEALPGWREAYEIASNRGAGFTAVSLHPTEATETYVTQHAIPFPVWTATLDRTSPGPIPAVPFTVLYEPGPTVKRTWRGVLQPEDLVEIAASLGGANR